MAMFRTPGNRTVFGAVVALALAVLSSASTPAQAADPIRVGFSLALTGAGASPGKMILAALEIWRDDVNAKGGLIGRPVELVYYDDQSTPSTVPGIYTKLLTVDKVDLVLSGYATNQIAPAMPVIMQRGMVFMGLFALAINEQFNYPYYFDIQPVGPNGKSELSRGFFELA